MEAGEVNLFKTKGPDYSFREKKEKSYFWKSMLLFGVINVILTLMNIEKYFINVEEEDDKVIHNTTLSLMIKSLTILYLKIISIMDIK